MPNSGRHPISPQRRAAHTPKVVNPTVAPFCRVERRGPDRTRHYVVHTASPRFVVELERAEGKNAHLSGTPGVIRRVCVPNSWAGDYHHSAQLLGAAIAFFESPESQRQL